jgi:hypothetical protein
MPRPAEVRKSEGEEETICNLNDDNMFFKTKPMYFVEYTPTVSSRDHRNNIESAVRAINILHGLSEQDTDFNASTNKSNLNNKEASSKEKTAPQAVYIADDSVTLIIHEDHDSNTQWQ